VVIILYIGYKCRLLPTKEQASIILHNINCSRFVYNYLLSLRVSTYEGEGNQLFYADMCRVITALRHDPFYHWLSSADVKCLKQSAKDLDDAFKNFYAHTANFPKFHRKRECGSYRTYPGKLSGNRVRIPKVGMVKFIPSKELVGRVVNATISRSLAGKYYISFCVETDEIMSESCAGVIGIDVGIRHFYTDNLGNVIDMPDLTKLYILRDRAQHRLSRKTKGSKNREKQRIRLARIYEKITNIRNDFLHKLSTRLVNENQVIAIEHLDVSSMMKDKNVAFYIQNSCFSTFFAMLSYKSLKKVNCALLRVDKFFPSSQLCSNCGYKNSQVKDLSIREWTCPNCGSHHDRDINAAKNILKEGLKQLA